MHKSPISGEPLPHVALPLLGGGKNVLGDAPDWALIIIYRGLHCGKCKDYLRELDRLLPDFEALGVSVVCASADPVGKAQAFVDEIGYSGKVAYDLNVPQMRALGVYISDPLSDSETDRPFAEPGLFVVNPDGNLQVHDISTAPWARPSLEAVRDGIAFAQNMGRPPRGTH